MKSIDTLAKFLSRRKITSFLSSLILGSFVITPYCGTAMPFFFFFGGIVELVAAYINLKLSLRASVDYLYFLIIVATEQIIGLVIYCALTFVPFFQSIFSKYLEDEDYTINPGLRALYDITYLFTDFVILQIAGGLFIGVIVLVYKLLWPVPHSLADFKHRIANGLSFTKSLFKPTKK